MKKIFTKQNIVRFALFVGAVALIMLAMPRDDRRTYLYEKNQPWRYPLLTAQFPLLLQSTLKIPSPEASLMQTM